MNINIHDTEGKLVDPSIMEASRLTLVYPTNGDISKAKVLDAGGNEIMCVTKVTLGMDANDVLPVLTIEVLNPKVLIQL